MVRKVENFAEQVDHVKQVVLLEGVVEEKALRNVGKNHGALVVIAPSSNRS